MIPPDTRVNSMLMTLEAQRNETANALVRQVAEAAVLQATIVELRRENAELTTKLSERSEGRLVGGEVTELRAVAREAVREEG